MLLDVCEWAVRIRYRNKTNYVATLGENGKWRLSYWHEQQEQVFWYGKELTCEEMLSVDRMFKMLGFSVITEE